MKTLILGLGNPILTDDGVGIEIAQKIAEERPDLEVVETCEAGLALLDYIAGHDKLIIIDSIRTEDGRPGELYKLELGDFKAATALSFSHGVDIASAFKVAEGLGYKIPRNVTIYAVEVKDNSTFGQGCTEEVSKRIPFIVRQIMREERL